MNYGMLWFDDDPKTKLAEKIKLASDYYKSKYGQTPNQCYIHPEMSVEDGAATELIKVTASPTILRHHLWIGVNTRVKS